MKSLAQINHDNRMTSRDFGSMCNWFVFQDGDLVACFVEEADANEFVANYQYEHGIKVDIIEAQP